MKAPTTAENKPFTHFFKTSRRFIHSCTPDIITFQFKDENTTARFYQSLKEKLPLLNTEYPKIAHREVQLTKEEELFFLRLVMCESGKLDTGYLDESLLKTLRADEFDFSYQFILGIIPGHKNARRLHNLRPKERKRFIITPDGTIICSGDKKAMYTPQQKEGFSQIQSNTLLDPNALSKAFGFFIDARNSKLYGIITHKDDALLNRLLTDDSGTINRIFDHDTNEIAQKSLENLRDRLYTTSQLQEFKKANQKARRINSRTNEVLSRIRFNPYRSVVCICADTLEARLLAYDFAQELLEHYRIYAKGNGYTLNPNFKIPIIFYLPSNKPISRQLHDIKLYTQEMLTEDREKATKIYNNIDNRLEQYKKNNFEFLLGLPEITSEILLDEYLGMPLAYIMMQKGYTRMLMRLLRPKLLPSSSTDVEDESSLRAIVFRSLINRSPALFEQNDEIISKLVLAEQFDIANKLIAVTGSKKNNLKLRLDGHTTLLYYLLEKGNPRQIAFMGLDEMLLTAASHWRWLIIKLCLKEFRNISEDTLKKISNISKDNRNISTSAFLYQLLPTSKEIVNNLLYLAILDRNWNVIIKLLKLPRELLDHALLADAAFNMLNDNKPELTILVLKFLLQNPSAIYTTSIKGSKIAGCLYVAITHGFVDLIPYIIELERRFQDEFVHVRFLVALELSYELGNSEIIAILEKNVDLANITDPLTIKKAICYLVTRAFSDDNNDLAKKRLLNLCHKYQLLPIKNDDFYDAIQIVIDYLSIIAPSEWSINSKIIPHLTKLFLDNRDIRNLNRLILPEDGDFYSALYHPISYVFETLLLNLSPSNIVFIKQYYNDHIKPGCGSARAKWKEKLYRTYEQVTRGEKFDEEHALLLFEVGLLFNKASFYIGFEEAINRQAFKVAKFLFEHPAVNEEIRDNLIDILLRGDLSAINTFMPTLENRIKPLHIRSFSLRCSQENHSVLNALLNQLDKKKFCNEQYIWDFYTIYLFNFQVKNSIEDTLICLLNPSIIRHFMLLFLVFTLKQTNLLIEEQKNPRESCRWPNVVSVINNKSAYNAFSWMFSQNDSQNNSHLINLLDILDCYLIDINTSQSFDSTFRVYSQILLLFKESQDKSSSLRFYQDKRATPAEFYRNVYSMMEQLDRKLKGLNKADLSPERCSTTIIRG